jgi:cell division protease FtsH
MINEQYARAKEILLEHKEGHNQLAELLISREVIFAEDVEHIFGKRPWTSRSQEIMEANEAIEKANEPTLDDMPEEVKKAQAEYEKKAEPTEQREQSDAGINSAESQQKPTEGQS